MVGRRPRRKLGKKLEKEQKAYLASRQTLRSLRVKKAGEGIELRRQHFDLETLMPPKLYSFHGLNIC